MNSKRRGTRTALVAERIQQAILLLRGHKVMLDFDLAGRKLEMTEMDNGKKKVPTLVTPVYSVTKTTIDDTVVLAGYHDKAAVYGN